MSLFNLSAVLGLDSSEYERGLDAAENKANSFGTKLKSSLATVAKVTAGAIGAGVAGVTALTKAAVDSFSSYEQLKGGIETLFGDSAERVMRDASNAYKTAGMDANKYMETSIQAAAALINSLEGDTEKAAELMNVSIIDMSDNVNKMGTTMEAVQNAYRGFSRGNFTMLDNLALGYAGTKESMKELLDRANEINAAHGIMSEYAIDSYSDIVQAIHVVQKEMGIAGTTAEEAEGTITGSFAALRAGWKNLVTSLATGEGDIDKLINDIVEGAELAFGNLLPAIERSLIGIGNLVGKLGPVIIEKLPEIFEEVLPALVNAVNEMIKSVAKALPGLVKSFSKVIPQIINVFMQNVPEFLRTAASIIVALIDGLEEALPDLLAYIPTLIESIADVIASSLPIIASAAFKLIQTIVKGIIDNLPNIVKAAGRIITSLVNGLSNNLSAILNAALEIIKALVKGLIDNLPEILDAVLKIASAFLGFVIDNLGDILEAGSKILSAVIDGILNNLGDIIDAAIKLIDKIFDELTKDDNLEKILNAGLKILVTLASGIVKAIPKLLLELPKVTEAIWDAITKIDWIQLGKNIIGSLSDGLVKAGKDLWNLTEEIFQDYYNRVQDYFGQNKDDKLYGNMSKASFYSKAYKDLLKDPNFDQFSKENTDLMNDLFLLTQGIAPKTQATYDKINKELHRVGYITDEQLGIQRNPYARQRNITGVGEMGNEKAYPIDEFERRRNIIGTGYVTAAEKEAWELTNAEKGVTINVYGAEGQDVSELAEIVSQKIAKNTRQERMAW